MIKDNVLKPV